MVFIGILLLIIASTFGIIAIAGFSTENNQYQQSYDQANNITEYYGYVYVLGIVSIILLIAGIWLIVSNIQIKPN
jgi:uncharacterized membrane protein